MSNQELNKRLKQLKIEDFLWLIYIGIIFMSWYSNYFERRYFIYNDLESINNSPVLANIFPSYKTQYIPGEKNHCLFTIQAMLYAITLVIKNIGSLDITGILDAKTVFVVKNIQRLSNIPENGSIDCITWKKISQLYSLVITSSVNEKTPKSTFNS